MKTSLLKLKARIVLILILASTLVSCSIDTHDVENLSETAVNSSAVTMNAMALNSSASVLSSVDDDTDDYVYDHYIWTADDLIAWNEATQSDPSLSAKLMDDITLPEGSTWTPVGSSNWHYIGVFNGNGKTITGMTISDPSLDYVGMFGFIDARGEVKNLTLESANITGTGTYTGIVAGVNYGTITACHSTGTVSGESYVGGIAGFNSSEGGTISGCSSDATVVGNNNMIGGIVGYNAGTITDCESTGSISGVHDVGGIAGRNWGTISYCDSSVEIVTGIRAGGIAGYNESGIITNCDSSATVGGSKYVGGIAGFNGQNSYITSCDSTATVTGTGTYIGGIAGVNDGEITDCNSTGGEVDGVNYVGGIVGFSNSNSSITACHSTIAVSGENHVGGIAGYGAGYITGCYSTGEIEGTNFVGGITGRNWKRTMTACYSTATVEGGNHVGGISGYNDSGIITTCYSTATVEGTGTYVGGIVGLNTQNIADGLDMGIITACYWSSSSVDTGIGYDKACDDVSCDSDCENDNNAKKLDRINWEAARVAMNGQLGGGEIELYSDAAGAGARYQYVHNYDDNHPLTLEEEK